MTRLGSSPSALDSVNTELFLSSHHFMRIGLFLSVYGIGRLELLLSALDYAMIGSSLSLQGSLRAGPFSFVYGVA